MAVSLHSNRASLRSQRALEHTNSSVGRALERLSSGQRINRASDDAASLAVGERLRVDTQLYRAAGRNLNDGISLLNILDGTLTQQANILTRLQELAEQSASGTFSDDQRLHLHREYRALVREFGRLGDAANFNGISLLRAGHSDGVRQLTFQAGITGSAGSVLTVDGIESASMSGIVNRDTIASANWDGSTTAPVLNVGDFTSIMTYLSLPHTRSDLFSRYGDAMISLEAADESGVMRELLIGFSRSYMSVDSPASVSVHVFAEGANGLFGADVTRNVTEWQQGTFSIDTETGRIQGDAGFTATLNFNNFSESVQISLDFSAVRFLSSAESGMAQDAIEFTGVESTDRARAALTTLKARHTSLGTVRGEVGALQARLENAFRATIVNGENVRAAESRIRDVDVAAETARLAAAQILQQTGAAVLAQANAQPELGILLLRS